MQNKKYDYVIFLCRVQPPHKVHIDIMRQAFELGKEVIVLIGSANAPRTFKNPWLWKERATMIRGCFNAEENLRLHINGVEDRLYNENLWVQQVQRAIDEITGKGKRIALIGCHKDASSYYLDEFPQWTQIEIPEHKFMNATDIRNIYLDPHHILLNEATRGKIEKSVEHYLIDFAASETYKDLVEEFEFQRSHDEMWATAPYPVSFNCADAVVFHSGHILLVKRRNVPGLNLWAIPGGYINMDEDPLDATIRELIEETKLKGPGAMMLKDKVFASHLFAHPKRSLRGRIYSHAFGINLGNGKLPKVKGADDALKAKWFTLEEVDNMRDQIFEDHACIITYFKGVMERKENK